MACDIENADGIAHATAIIQSQPSQEGLSRTDALKQLAALLIDVKGTSKNTPDELATSLLQHLDGVRLRNGC